MDGKAVKAGIFPANWGLLGVVWDSREALLHHKLEIYVQSMRIL